jgi:long-chain acyl-CoA synthetase
MGRANCNVADFLLEGKPAEGIVLHLLNGEKTYGQLQAATSAFSCYFCAIGCQPGDRVLLVAENSFFWVSAYLGILRARLVCVPLPTSISSEDIEHVVLLTEPSAAVVQNGFAKSHAHRLRGLHWITDREIEHVPDSLTQIDFAIILSQQWSETTSHSEVASADLAALMFTSGSTRKPRGVMVSHGNIIANTISIIQCLQLTQADRTMTVLPFHYCFGTSLLWTHLRVGASLVLDSRFMYPEVILQRMLEVKCTGFAGVPSHYQILLRHSTMSKKSFPCLRYIQQAGGPLSPVFIRELRVALPTTKIFIMYGQTEATARLSYLPPEYLNRKLGSIGRGIPGVELRVLNKCGNPVLPGQVGEIVAKGDNITLGYWRAPLETADTFRDGAVYTGDLATVDEDGFIYIVDRAQDFLKCGGKRISCRDIEDRILECAQVLEAAVVGVPDEVLGEAVKVFAVPLTPDCTGLQEILHNFCKKNMPSHLIPTSIVVVQALPKNSAGKILKHKLKTAA